MELGLLLTSLCTGSLSLGSRLSSSAFCTTLIFSRLSVSVSLAGSSHVEVTSLQLSEVPLIPVFQLFSFVSGTRILLRRQRGRRVDVHSRRRLNFHITSLDDGAAHA